MNIATLVVSVAALSVAVWSYVGSSRKAEAANKAARDSADAAKRSATAAERQVELAEVESTRYRIPWDLRQQTENTWLLFNDGDEPAFGVMVDSVEGRLKLMNVPFNVEIGPRSGKTFTASRSNRAWGDQVRVIWRRTPNGEEMIWEHPLAE